MIGRRTVDADELLLATFLKLVSERAFEYSTQARGLFVELARFVCQSRTLLVLASG